MAMQRKPRGKGTSRVSLHQYNSRVLMYAANGSTLWNRFRREHHIDEIDESQMLQRK